MSFALPTFQVPSASPSPSSLTPATLSHQQGLMAHRIVSPTRLQQAQYVLSALVLRYLELLVLPVGLDFRSGVPLDCGESHSRLFCVRESGRMECEQ